MDAGDYDNDDDDDMFGCLLCDLYWIAASCNWVKSIDLAITYNLFVYINSIFGYLFFSYSNCLHLERRAQVTIDVLQMLNRSMNEFTKAGYINPHRPK